MSDEIIQELWRIKDELAREVNYNIHTLCRELQKKQSSSGALIVDRSTCRTSSDDVCQGAGG